MLSLRTLTRYTRHLSSLNHSGAGRGVPFLDTLVTVEERINETKLETELYIKPTNSGIVYIISLPILRQQNITLLGTNLGAPSRTHRTLKKKNVA